MKSVMALGIFLAAAQGVHAESVNYIECTGAQFNLYQDADTAPQAVLPFDIATYPDTDKKGIGAIGCLETLTLGNADHSCDLNIFSGLVDSRMLKLRLQIGVANAGGLPGIEELVVSALLTSKYRKACNSGGDCYGYLYQGSVKIYDDSDPAKLLQSIPVKCEWTHVPSNMAG